MFAQFEKCGNLFVLPIFIKFAASIYLSKQKSKIISSRQNWHEIDLLRSLTDKTRAAFGTNPKCYCVTCYNVSAKSEKCLPDNSLFAEEMHDNRNKINFLR